MLAATSQPSLLDPAVRRPGRFDREIELGASSPPLLPFLSFQLPRLTDFFHGTGPPPVPPLAMCICIIMCPSCCCPGVPGDQARASILRALLHQAGSAGKRLLDEEEEQGKGEGPISAVASR